MEKRVAYALNGKKLTPSCCLAGAFTCLGSCLPICLLN